MPMLTILDLSDPSRVLVLMVHSKTNHPSQYLVSYCSRLIEIARERGREGRGLEAESIEFLLINT